MQYLDLVHLAERKRDALPGQRHMPARLRMPVVGACLDPRGNRPDDDGPFFTDGPYIETKEYTGAGRNT